ncbi:hypothetical protein NC651_001482 [Populus alba x Populus x berolinensis]|nr:hypothetical protein NC651_001482 [Populus alba x Populus x berolinensis]
MIFDLQVSRFCLVITQIFFNLKPLENPPCFCLFVCCCLCSCIKKSIHAPYSDFDRLHPKLPIFGSVHPP